ncbi:DUF2851 family protein [Pedobacter hartonius]|uniref:DUF2851 domain-containing protein n=1 Tax=Pedobacter hartonius TaxID=425514 RepID=A0A1H4GGR0_9SPHI|nr:DUF2851 family protein [Pedobacter hartonius]SEB08451.1 Protein of unknown function [Pedobacter hartonius]
MRLNEDFLHYIWQYRLLTRLDLYCTNGETLQIIHPGSRNTNAGPDFNTAKLRIGGQLWVGDVEIHVRASDWLLHHHQENRSYDSVILHVVCEDDAVICRTDGSLVPVFLLKDLIPEAMFGKYRALLEGRNFFPCAQQIGQVDHITVQRMLNRMVTERFLEKTAELEFHLEQNHHNWNETFHMLLIRNFGFRVNNLPFQLLAAGLPATLLAKHRDQPLQIEALLFGQAGFLEGDFKDSYPRQLQSEYLFLKKKYQLQPEDKSLWKFLRMHPQNFPVLRIAQLAGMLTGSSHLFAEIIGLNDLKELRRLFSPGEVHPYWKDHVNFDRGRREMPVRLGRKSAENLIINTVCFILYCYGTYFNLPELKQRATGFLKKIPAERNAVTAHYRKAGLKLSTAYDSQAVLQLHKYCCSSRKCLNCEIGIEIITK